MKNYVLLKIDYLLSYNRNIIDTLLITKDAIRY